MITDYSRYKRLFVFGCSYTSYIWPTWANILSKAMPHAKFYNFGKIGSGNLFISMRISEISKRLKFDKDDLIVVMWTSMTREDRHIDGQWQGQGNIYNQDLYPKNFVRDFCQPDFFLIRDTSLMNITQTYLRSLPCTSIFLNAWPINSSDHIESTTNDFYTDYILNDITYIYEDALRTPKPLRMWIDEKLEQDPKSVGGHQYINGSELIYDFHPNPLTAGTYLKDIGFNLPSHAEEYILTSNDKLSKIKYKDEIFEQFAYCENNIPYPGIF